MTPLHPRQTSSALTDPDRAHDLNARAKELQGAAREVQYAAEAVEWCLWAREQTGMNTDYIERKYAEATEKLPVALDALLYVIEDRALLDRLQKARSRV